MYPLLALPASTISWTGWEQEHRIRGGRRPGEEQRRTAVGADGRKTGWVAPFTRNWINGRPNAEFCALKFHRLPDAHELHKAVQAPEDRFNSHPSLSLTPPHAVRLPANCGITPLIQTDHASGQFFVLASRRSFLYHSIRMNGSLPVKTSLPHEARFQGWVELLKTLADPIRLRVIRLLEQQGAAGLGVGELGHILKLPQSTVSRHLKTLIDAGMAAARRDGTSMYYRLSDDAQVNSMRRLRDLSKPYLDSDPLARTDSQRLSHVLRQRDDETLRFFGKAAPQWDQIRRQWFGDVFHLEAMLALLNPEWVPTVADLGTGTGAMLPLVAPHRHA